MRKGAGMLVQAKTVWGAWLGVGDPRAVEQSPWLQMVPRDPPGLYPLLGFICLLTSVPSAVGISCARQG